MAMHNRIENNTESKVKVAEYVIIGAGPSAICAIPNILNSGVSKTDIIWIDPQFKVGDFGTVLSVGSSVPGNTTVKNYQKVNKEIYKMVPECAPQQNQIFEIDRLQPNFICSLKIATDPMQHITNELRKVVPSVEGRVINILTTREGLTLEIKLSNGTSKYIKSKRVIIATGAKPKTLKLPTVHNEITMIDPNVVFIQTSLSDYLCRHPSITTVAVIGSSHSAALATMHLLKAGLTVKQFMNKAYKYATPCISPNGAKYTRDDNTGLKGDVAKFTRKLFDDIKLDTGEHKGKLRFYIGKDQQEANRLLEKHLFGCSYAVATIGYEPSNTLQVNNMPLSTLTHNNKTTEFKEVKGLFGIGIAYPQEVKSISGEIEPAVGVGKFWATANNPNVIEIWKESYAGNLNKKNLNFIDSGCNSRLFKTAILQPQQGVTTTALQIRSRL
jgi:thioredoxin reductase